jgi:TonB family protein
MILLLISVLFQTVAPASAPPRLVNENANVRATDGVLELRGGRGWLRTERPLLDFEVTFEIRALTPDADPGVVVRSWRGWQLWPERGYRFTIPVGTPIEASKLLVARQQQMKLIQEGTLNLRPHGDWQTLRVTGHRGRVRLAVNDTVAADFAIENHGGYLMFDNRKGRVEIRAPLLRTSELNEPIPTDLVRVEALKKSGGTAPEVLQEVKPHYTPEAMRALVQGSVKLEAVVLADGHVGPVRVLRSRDKDLDISAVAALKAWRFRPGVLNGTHVPVVVEVEMSFGLK